MAATGDVGGGEGGGGGEGREDGKEEAGFFVWEDGIEEDVAGVGD